MKEADRTVAILGSILALGLLACFWTVHGAYHAMLALVEHMRP